MYLPIPMKNGIVLLLCIKIIEPGMQILADSLDRTVSSNFGKRHMIKNWEKMIDLTSKLGEINDIEHNKGSKIYPQNQVILDYIMSSIPLKHKCLSIILILVIVSH